LKLLRHYEIQKPLRSYHKFNERKRCDEIIADLKAGVKVALITDAGTPLISDPGEILVQRCVEEQVPITTIPGPCAAIAALTLSGFSAVQFQLVSFLPKKSGGLTKALTALLASEGTSICYESPYRLVKAGCLCSLSPGRKVAVARELTKIHEGTGAGPRNSSITILKSP
jgi:16S rRNA (cytidine1402-2'-O)-methyltransferase